MKAIVKIPNISWRDGRPRFNPGPKLRALGLKGEDLRHPNGQWFTLRETEDWATAKSAQIKRAQKAKAGGKPFAPAAEARRPGVYTIGDLFIDFFRSKKYIEKRAATKNDYRRKAKAFGDFEPLFFTVPAYELTPAAVHGLYEQLWQAKGLAMANGMMAVLRRAYSIGVLRGKVSVNPCLKMEMETPKPRLRCASVEEVAALMAAADADEPSLGDAIMLALFSGQRQSDVLALREEGTADGRIRLRQAKTGAIVSVFALPQLVARLAVIRARNRAEGRVSPVVVAHPRTGDQWNKYNFTHRFAEIRAAAAKQCPSVADFRFQDLRDTAVTWLHRAGCTEAEIASVTGHSEKTVSTILKHYLVKDEGTNDRAMAKLGKYLEREGVKL